VPKAKLVAYVINPNMEVSADSIPFDVEIGNPVGLSASFSTETAAPGETVVIDLQSAAGIATMIGISVVDESVYALNEGRLNLKQIFDELEKIFMEPRAEAHPDEGRFWIPTGTGAADVFKDAGVQVIASGKLDIPQAYGGWGWNFRGGDMVLEAAGMDDAANKASPPSMPTSQQPQTGQDGLAEVERIRQFFPETWYWNPLLATNDRGQASVELTVPDTITTWKLHAVSSSIEGIGMAETSLRVFQDFFVEPDLPYAVTRGEEFPVLVQVYNYLDTSQTVQVEITEGDWFELIDERIKIGTVPGNSVASIAFTIKPGKIGHFKIEITARTTEKADAVKKNVLVEAEGTPREIVQNGFITASEPRKYNLTLPEGIVEDSGRVLLSITPSLVGQTISGMEDLLGLPYGCGEQNMMFMAPDLEILRYLDATDQVVPEIRAKAEMFLTTGYQRELTYRRNDGSFSAFGQSDDEGSLWLTAFVLDVFSEAREVMSIDEAVLAEAAAWIESHQNADGTWDPVGFVIHKEMMGSMTDEAKTALTTFVAVALADYGSAEDSLGRAVSYLESYAINDKDVYALALTAYLLEKIGSPSSGAAIAKLLETAKTDENGMYWSVEGIRSSEIETTSYAVLALMLAGRSEAEQAIRWLASQRNSFGGFSSTQDTVMAMKALMMAARLQARNIDSHVIVMVDGNEFASIELTEANFDVLQLVELPDGAEELDLTMIGDGKVMYQVVKKFNVPGEIIFNPEFQLNVDYNTTSAQVNDIVEVTAKVTYNGFFNSTGMLILDIAVPTGFLPVQSTLDGVISSGLATRVEVAGRKVIFYIDDLERGEELEIQFNIVALFPVRAKGGTSTAYSYYKPEVKTEARGQDFDVGGEVQSRFGWDPEEDDESDDDEEPEPTPPQFPFTLIAVLAVALILAAVGKVRERN
ncbi:MAG: alpha-2-macroglobulin, partial [Theionarchaea archaeon]|nr:alpha-2-macroglobulin [Theionarchaea archaeon]